MLEKGLQPGGETLTPLHKNRLNALNDRISGLFEQGTSINRLLSDNAVIAACYSPQHKTLVELMDDNGMQELDLNGSIRSAGLTQRSREELYLYLASESLGRAQTIYWRVTERGALPETFIQLDKQNPEEGLEELERVFEDPNLELINLTGNESA